MWIQPITYNRTTVASLPLNRLSPYPLKGDVMSSSSFLEQPYDVIAYR